MASLFVDTNVFLRFLTNDDPVKAKRAESLFRDALRGKVKLATSLLVIAEIVWTLESFYKLEKSDIAAKVEKILNTANLHCPEAPLLFMALDLYVHANIDFVDAYNAFHMKDQGLTQILTYDRKHFTRISWVRIGDL
ncbi:MAG: Ribonuclease VapC [Candidatus Nitrospira kreftii]|uniref:Ribonuclease VapC n=1 Tax=Candidatus Nitrospira kreftii TaxID=2652173 RepID=A0A7S8FFL8_9BACT|nr:MAG: Ribonuclease VapC [Candidatus Nitrospira kreftii]